jgi:hypothetical protein
VSGAGPHIADCTGFSCLIGVETPNKAMLAAQHAAQHTIRVMEARRKFRQMAVARGMIDDGVAILAVILTSIHSQVQLCQSM